MFAEADDQEVNVLHPLELEGSPSESMANSRMPSIDLEPSASPSLPASTGTTHFEPLGDDDVYDVFDLELTLGAGGKETGIDARYRSSDSSSGRPTYKIQKKTKAHFLGKKHMTVDVTRSLAWDSIAGTAMHNGSKGYVNAFSARDQPSRSVALSATNSVLSRTSFGGVIDVSSVCGSYDPSHSPHRETSAHHFFTVKLNDACVPDNPKYKTKLKPAAVAGTRSRRGARQKTPLPVAAHAPATHKEYTGGGHFLLDGAPRGRSDLVSTLYCTGYEQRPYARGGDIIVAELRVRPVPSTPSAAPPPNGWGRFFKERHASVHVARRGLDACMTGPHVQMLVPEAEAGKRAVLAHGQALEIVLAAISTALLALEHDGLESKRWAWLLRGPPRPMPMLALGPGPGPASPGSESDNPGLASPDGDGEGDSALCDSDDDSQGPPTAAFVRPSVGGLFVLPSRSIDERRSYAVHDGGSRSGEGAIGNESEQDEWVPVDNAAPGPPPPAHLRSESPFRAAAAAWARVVPERKGSGSSGVVLAPELNGSVGVRPTTSPGRKGSVVGSVRTVGSGPTGTLRIEAERKGSVASERSIHVSGAPTLRGLAPGLQQHLKAGSWPEKHRRSVVVLERKESSLLGHGAERKEALPLGPPSTFPRVWVDAHGQNGVQERDEYYS